MGEALLTAVFQSTLACTPPTAALMESLSQWCASALPWRIPEADVFISPLCSFAGSFIGCSEYLNGPKLEFRPIPESGPDAATHCQSRPGAGERPGPHPQAKGAAPRPGDS